MEIRAGSTKKSVFVIFSPLFTNFPFSREGESRKFVAYDVSAGRNENATAKLPISSPRIFLAPLLSRFLPAVKRDRRDSARSFPSCRQIHRNWRQRAEQKFPDILVLLYYMYTLGYFLYYTLRTRRGLRFSQSIYIYIFYFIFYILLF